MYDNPPPPDPNALYAYYSRETNAKKHAKNRRKRNLMLEETTDGRRN